MRNTQSTDAVRSYLKSIGRVPLLTHEEEITYGHQVKDMMHLKAEREELIDELGHQPALDIWAERAGVHTEDLKNTLQKGEQAKRNMIKANLRLVVSIAKKIYPSKSGFVRPDPGRNHWFKSGGRKNSILRKDIDLVPMLTGGYVRPLREPLLNKAA